MPHWKHLAKQAVKPAVVPILARLDRRTQAQLTYAGILRAPGSPDGDVGDLIAAVREVLPGMFEAMSVQHAAARANARVLAGLERRVGELEVRGRADEQALREATAVGDLLTSTRAELSASLDSQAQALADLQSAVSSHVGTLVAVQERLEFVRTETLFEARYGSSGRGAENKPVAARILDERKVAEYQGRVRLNLGAGHVPLDGFLNVDSRELPGIDVLADVTELPFEPGGVAEIRSEHLLEHFPEEQLKRQLLPYWRSLLSEDGAISAVVPDTLSMLKAYSEGEMPFSDLRLVLFGGQEYDGDFHFTAFSEETLSDLFRAVGLDHVEVVARGRRNGLCLEMELIARTGPRG